MSAEEHRALVRRSIEVVWKQRNTAVLDELLAPHYQRSLSAAAALLSSEGQRQRMTGFHIAFPNLHFTIEDLFAEGNPVTFRAMLRGTHQRPLSFVARHSANRQTGNDLRP